MESSERFDAYLLDADSENPSEQGTITEPSTGETDNQDDAQTAEIVSDTDDANADSETIDDAIDLLVKGNGHTESDEISGDLDVAEQCSERDASDTLTLLDELDSDSPAVQPAIPLADPPVSPFRAASLSVADAIESAVTTSEQRHDHLQGRFESLTEKQVAADEKQEQLSRSVTSIQSWQSQSDGRLNQLDLKQRTVIDSQKSISESVNSVLTNQKTSAKCYNEVMAGLNAIQSTQQFDQQRLDELTKQFDDRLADLRKSVIVGGVVIGVLAAIAIVVSIL